MVSYCIASQVRRKIAWADHRDQTIRSGKYRSRFVKYRELQIGSSFSVLSRAAKLTRGTSCGRAMMKNSKCRGKGGPKGRWCC